MYRSVKDIAFRSQEFHLPSLREQWQRILRHGDLTAAKKLLDKDDISPNSPAKATMEHPLKTLLLSSAKQPDVLGQSSIAYTLIAKGAELRAPDKYMMLPADYALFSSNRDAALIVIRETIRQLGIHRRQSYKPFPDPYFAICMDRDERYRRYQNMITNFRNVARVLLGNVDDNFREHDPRIGGHIVLNDTEKSFWSRAHMRKIIDMPYHTPALARAIKEKAQDVGMVMSGYRGTLHLSQYEEMEQVRDYASLQEYRRVRLLIKEDVAPKLS